MPYDAQAALDFASPPFDQYGRIQPLAPKRSGHASTDHVRHLLYAGRDRRTRTGVLIKVSNRPGLVYQHNLTNEIASLTTINRELPDSRYFPILGEHGRLKDGRVFVTMSLFDELPLATTIGAERTHDTAVAHLRIAIEVSRALAELHRVGVFHVDLNPMNILYRSERGRPVIRIVDFESSYEPARHAASETYDPPTTSGFSPPEVPRLRPDARADVFSLGAVLYTLQAGFQWTWQADARTAVDADRRLDPELKEILLTAVDPDRDRRHRSVDELGGALGAYLERIWPGRSWQ